MILSKLTLLVSVLFQVNSSQKIMEFGEQEGC